MFKRTFPMGLASAVLLLLLATGATGDDPVVVVVNARNPAPSLETSAVKNMFTGNVAFWQGTVPITLVTRSPESEAGERFLAEVLDSTPQRFEATWQARQLAGRGVAPRVAATPDDVATAVASTPGAIGYLLASEVWDVLPPGVKVVEIR